MPRFQLRRHATTEEHRLICGAIGRRTLVDWPDQIGAMWFAHAFWDTLRWVFLALWLVPLVIIGALDHTLLGGPIRSSFAVAFGGTILAVVEVVITFFRRWTTID